MNSSLQRFACCVDLKVPSHHILITQVQIGGRSHVWLQKRFNQVKMRLQQEIHPIAFELLVLTGLEGVLRGQGGLLMLSLSSPW